ncbi:MAG: amidohydrolase family protein [Acidimicrobiales bacterium]
MEDFDIHIKGGVVVDGTRVPRFKGDVWIKDGKIAQIGGRVNGGAEQTIDADGLIVAPGFVDLHTHYDAQIRWDPYCTISGWHGVTSVVLGNCGFGFAPCKPDFVERSMRTMTRTEAIPYDSIREGVLPVWDWETMPEYLDNLDRIPKGVNCLQYMPLVCLVTYVMGLEAAKSRPATKAEQQEMQRLLNEGMDAGLAGFSYQRRGPNSVQSDVDGTPMVTDTMCDEDLLALAQVLADRDEGFIQVSESTGDREADMAFIEKLAGVSGRPVLWNTILPARRNPAVHREPIEWLGRCWDKGLQVYGQCAIGRAGYAFTLEHWNLYDTSPEWRAITTGDKEEKRAKMSDPDLRAKLVAAHDTEDKRLRQIQSAVGGQVEALVIQGVNRQQDLQKYVGKSVGQIAEEENKHVIEVMLDLTLAGDLNVEFLGPDKGSNADFMTEMMLNPYCLPGVSDGGAHTKFFTGGAWPTDILRWLVRDEGKVTLEEAHYRISALAAHAAGFKHRGFLREGAGADVVVYDMEELDIDPSWVGEVSHDLPGNEWRRIQRAKGYRSIIVNGEETFSDGKCTGATPGRLLRHGKG